MLGQGEQAWTDTTGSSYLPRFELVDAIECPAVAGLIPGVVEVLAPLSFLRLRRADVADFLPESIDVPTILGDPPKMASTAHGLPRQVLRRIQALCSTTRDLCELHRMPRITRRTCRRLPMTG